MPGHYTAKQKKNRKVGGEIRQQQQLEEYKKRERRRVLEEKFKSAGIIDNNVVFTCGSSVTASVLGVAYSLINNKYMPTIYIGSWSEYGKNR